MQRFYLQNLNNNKIIIIKKDNEIYHQITKVIRWKIWDEVIFFDWKNYFDYLFFINEISKNEIIFKFKEKINKKSTPFVKENKDFFSTKITELNLYQAIPNKQEKIELILQKWTEIWYTNFYFYFSERSQKFNLSDNKFKRFQKIIVEATEQSWRNLIPELFFLEKLNLELIKWQNLYFHTKSSNSQKLKNIKIKQEKVNIFIWPEWWFSDNEISNFEKYYFQNVFLWDFILRTETVGLVVWFFLNQF